MSGALGRLILCVSGLGFSLTQLAIRRFGRPGATAVEGVCAGLLVRDIALIAGGAPGRLRRGPAVLLWLEASAAALAAATGLRMVLSEPAVRRATEGRPDPLELVRQGAIGVLFGMHTLRFWIYLQPGHGRKASPD